MTVRTSFTELISICSFFNPDNGRCDNLLLPNSSEKTIVVDQSSVSAKARARAGMVEAKLRYESVLVMDRGSAHCIILCSVYCSSDHPTDRWYSMGSYLACVALYRLLPFVPLAHVPLSVCLHLTVVEPSKLAEAEDKDEAGQEPDGRDSERSGSRERVSEEPVSSPQTLLRVCLETGRKHQIRAQMAHLGQIAH